MKRRLKPTIMEMKSPGMNTQLLPMRNMPPGSCRKNIMQRHR